MTLQALRPAALEPSARSFDTARASLCPDRPSLAPHPGLTVAHPGSSKRSGRRAPRRCAPARRAPAHTPLSAALEADLIVRYAPLVRQIAGGFQRKLPQSVLRDDLIAAGMAGLWDAIRKHGNDAGESFEWYVRVRIRGAILDELRAQDWLPRRMRAKNTEQDRDASLPVTVIRVGDVSEWERARSWRAGTGWDAELAVEGKDTAEAVARAVERLPDRERHIVAMHYFQGVKFKELGAELGVSEPRVSQLHSRALQRLRGMLEEQEAA